MITVDVSNRQTVLDIDQSLIQKLVRQLLDGENCPAAIISVAIVDDPTMHALNRQYLDHDYPTDVLSFLLDETKEGIEGEVIVSADTAINTAKHLGWQGVEELLLYVIHGMLHLVGYRDDTPQLRLEMRERERFYLSQFGLRARYEQSAETSTPPPISEHNGGRSQ